MVILHLPGQINYCSTNHPQSTAKINRQLDNSAFFRTDQAISPKSDTLKIYQVCFLDGEKTFFSPVQSYIKPS